MTAFGLIDRRALERDEPMDRPVVQRLIPALRPTVAVGERPPIAPAPTVVPKVVPFVAPAGIQAEMSRLAATPQPLVPWLSRIFAPANTAQAAATQTAQPTQAQPASPQAAAETAGAAALPGMPVAPAAPIQPQPTGFLDRQAIPGIRNLWLLTAAAVVVAVLYLRKGKR